MSGLLKGGILSFIAVKCSLSVVSPCAWGALQPLYLFQSHMLRVFCFALLDSTVIVLFVQDIIAQNNPGTRDGLKVEEKG